jgi:hypothetical protein
VDGRADQFSLGVVAYQMATGRKPFEADTWIAVSHKILNVEPEPAAKWNVSLKPASAAAIARALHKSPAARFPTCGEFAQAYEIAPAAETTRSAPPWWAAVAVLALAVAGGLGYWISREPAPNVVESKPEAPATTANEPVKPEPPKADTAKALPVADPLRLSVGAADFEFAEIKAGQFMMGTDAPYAEPDEKPRHLVRITRPYFLGKTEVTRQQWHAVMGGPAPGADDAGLPKTELSYNDAIEFLKKLNARGDGFRYRLPTEAEWEYAARAGSRDDLYGDMYQVAWFQKGNILAPRQVAEMEPNAWALHDVIGNAWEWVADWYDEEYYTKSPHDDPKGPPSGQFRVIRGGSYNSQGMILRVSYRAAVEPERRDDEYGFRFVREPVP